MPVPETLIAYMISVTYVSSILVQIVKGIWLDTMLPEGQRRTYIIQGINYGLNLVLLLVVLAVRGELVGTDFLIYLALALGQSVVGTVGYKQFSGGTSGGKGNGSGNGGDTGGDLPVSH